MNKHFQKIILKSTGAKALFEIEVIQNLWSGYGEIVRFGLQGAKIKSVVVKHVQLDQGNHPRGWNTDLSHQRKLKSYQVETAWYKMQGRNCETACRIPQCFAIESSEKEVLIVLEDLDESGFKGRRNVVSWNEIEATIKWLANFHATFLGAPTNDLWQSGTYWHLQTRPDELEVLEDLPLKNAASAIDKKLSESPFQTIVHGDAKLANFCFSNDGKKVAAVDFQYVGGGCGMKDLAYFVGSCMSEKDCEKNETRLLDFYFQELKKAVTNKNKALNFEDLEIDWRKLYHFAWADFHRFVKGWHPGHWKINSYSEKISRQVIQKLNF